MEKKEDRRIAMTKRLLKNAFIEMLHDKDIYHISIRELCENADVNRTTFYKHYGNQFDLLDDMENDFIEMFEKIISEDKNHGQTGVEQLLTFLEDNIDFVRLLFNTNVDPKFPKKLFSSAAIEKSAEDAMSNLPMPDREYIFRYILFGSYETVKYWLNKNERESPSEIARIVLDRFFLNINQA